MNVLHDLGGGNLPRLLETINTMVMDQIGFPEGHSEVLKTVFQRYVKAVLNQLWSVKTILYELVALRAKRQISDDALVDELTRILDSRSPAPSQCAQSQLSIIMFLALRGAASTGLREKCSDEFKSLAGKPAETLLASAIAVHAQKADSGHEQGEMQRVGRLHQPHCAVMIMDESMPHSTNKNACLCRPGTLGGSDADANLWKHPNGPFALNCVAVPTVSTSTSSRASPTCASAKVAEDRPRFVKVVENSDNSVSNVKHLEQNEEFLSDVSVKCSRGSLDKKEGGDENADATSSVNCTEEDSGEDYDDEDNEGDEDEEEEDSDNKPEVGDDEDDAEGVDEGGDEEGRDEEGGDDDAGDEEGAEEEGGDDEGADEEGGDDEGAEEEGGDEDADDEEGEEEEEGEGEDDEDEVEDSDEGEIEGAGEGGGEAQAEVEGEGEDDVDDREEGDEDEEEEEEGDEDGEEEPEEFDEEDDGDEDGDEQEVEDDDGEQDIEDEDDEDEAEESDEDLEPPKKKRK